MNPKLRPWEEAIFLAAASGNVNDLQRELRKQQNIELRDEEYQRTPLHWAVSGGHETAVQLLLAHGANANATEPAHGRTPLLLAVTTGAEPIAKQLIKARADVDAVDMRGDTPVLVATRMREAGMLKLLLEAGADVNVQTWSRSETALLIASKKGWEDMTDLLIQHKATTTLVDDERYTPLRYALENGHTSIAQALAAEEALERPGDAETILSEMAETLRVEAEDFDPYKDLGPGESLLKAMKDEQPDFALGILGKHADFNIDTKDDDGQTTLFWAASENNIEITRRLLDRGADVNAVNAQSWTPLMAAAERGHEEVGIYLLDKGAQADCQDEDGFTPLHLAASEGCVGLVERLLDAGVDPNVQNDFLGENLTAISKAAEGGQLEVVELLLARGASPNHDDRTLLSALYSDECHDAINTRGYLMIKLLVEKGACVFMDCWTDERPLVIAAERGMQNVVDLFLRANVTDAENRQEIIRDAVQHAAEHGEHRILAMLMEHYVFSESDREQEEPWIWARGYRFGSAVELMRPYFCPDGESSGDECTS